MVYENKMKIMRKATRKEFFQNGARVPLGSRTDAHVQQLPRTWTWLASALQHLGWLQPGTCIAGSYQILVLWTFPFFFYILLFLLCLLHIPCSFSTFNSPYKLLLFCLSQINYSKLSETVPPQLQFLQLPNMKSISIFRFLSLDWLTGYTFGWLWARWFEPRQSNFRLYSFSIAPFFQDTLGQIFTCVLGPCIRRSPVFILGGYLQYSVKK